MGRQFTLEYWQDEDWYVGRLREVPGVFSQGASLDELQENVRDAYRMMLEDQQSDVGRETRSKLIEVEV